MTGVFTDERGTIEDLIGPVDCVTRIHTVNGAVRGNHVHQQTVQTTLVLSGRLLMVHGGDTPEGLPEERTQIAGAGALVVSEPGVPHAWKALEDTDCLVFTRGPRSGENYESDTIRLNEPLLS